MPRMLTLMMALTMAVSASAADEQLKLAIAGDHRSEANQARDVYRHPAETLAFFGIKPDMTVVEIWPGGGWYSEILAPYLKDNGTYIAASFAKEPEGQYADYFKKARQKLIDKFAADGELYGSPQVTEFQPPQVLELAPAGSADMVLTFRNVHNWMNADGIDQAFAAFFKALKPGGVLGVVEHRDLAEGDQDPKAPSGYVKESFIISVAKQAGFELVASSPVNNNVKDTKDHEKGVWSLPPTFALGDENKDHFQAIGESDRMTLKFIKPKS